MIKALASCVVLLCLVLVTPSQAVLTDMYADFDLATGANDGTSESDAWQTCAAMRDGVAAGDHVYIQRTSSRHDCGGTITISAAGSNTQPIIYEGYLTTPGDGADDGINNYALIGRSASGNRKWTFSGAHVYIRHLDLAHNASTGIVVLSGRQITLYKSKFENTSTAATASVANASGDGAFIINNWFKGASSGSNTATVLTVSTGLALGNRLELTGSATAKQILRVNNTGNKSLVMGNVIRGPDPSSNTISGIRVNGAANDDGGVVINNSITDVGYGIHIQDSQNSGALGRIAYIGNLIHDVDNCVISDDATTDANYSFVFLSNACGGAGVSRYSNIGDKPILHDVTITTGPWVDQTTWNFTPNATAGGGAACVDIQEPVDSSFDGSNRNTMDIGAIGNGN